MIATRIEKIGTLEVLVNGKIVDRVWVTNLGVKTRKDKQIKYRHPEEVLKLSQRKYPEDKVEMRVYPLKNHNHSRDTKIKKSYRVLKYFGL